MKISSAKYQIIHDCHKSNIFEDNSGNETCTVHNLEPVENTCTLHCIQSLVIFRPFVLPMEEKLFSVIQEGKKKAT
jgi:hypothetical protein